MQPVLQISRSRRGQRGQTMMASRPCIVDLSVPIGPQTLSAPSVNRRLELTTTYRQPGHWQSSFVDMSLHTGSHADFPLHIVEGGASAGDVGLDRLCGPAVVLDLHDLAADQPITLEALEGLKADIRPGDIVLLRTGWAERMWGVFPDYYLHSPYCDAAACQWIIDRHAKAVGFDCFSEFAARQPDFSPADFVIHRIVLESGAVLLQHLTNLSLLPTNRHFEFFGPCLNIAGAEGSPARFFALAPDGSSGGDSVPEAGIRV